MTEKQVDMERVQEALDAWFATAGALLAEKIIAEFGSVNAGTVEEEDPA